MMWLNQSIRGTAVLLLRSILCGSSDAPFLAPIPPRREGGGPSHLSLRHNRHATTTP